MKIAILGLGYVGATVACCLASEGHSVLGIDVSESKVDALNDGHPPIAEPGLKSLLAKALDRGLIRATTAVPRGLEDCRLAIVCVGTPNAPDGSLDMSHIAKVSKELAEKIGEDRAEPLTVAYRSTMPPGSIEQLVAPIFRSRLGSDGMRALELVYNPEFLREATAVEDYFNPPKVVIGTQDGACSKTMDELYSGIEAPIFYTGYKEAEITKFVDNSWHAAKVAFANEIGRICTGLDIRTKVVHQIFASDTKLNISAYYTRPGGAFGGSCLPKDVRAMQRLAADLGAEAALLESLIASNETHKQFQFDLATKGLAGQAKVLLVGLAFKADTDDLRESPNLDMARRLLEAGYDLDVYDPGLDAARLTGQNLGYAYAHLPVLGSILVDRQTAEATVYDRVIAANDAVAELSLKPCTMVDIATLS